MSNMTVTEMEAFIDQYGIPAFLDHLGLDEAGNEVLALNRKLNAALRDLIATKAVVNISLAQKEHDV